MCTYLGEIPGIELIEQGRPWPELDRFLGIRQEWRRQIWYLEQGYDAPELPLSVTKHPCSVGVRTGKELHGVNVGATHRQPDTCSGRSRGSGRGGRPGWRRYR